MVKKVVGVLLGFLIVGALYSADWTTSALKVVSGTTEVGIMTHGRNWGKNVTLTDIYMIDQNTGFIVGGRSLTASYGLDDAASNPFFILKTTNGGTSWTTCPIAIEGTVTDSYHPGILLGVDFVDSNTGWAVGAISVTQGATSAQTPMIIAYTTNAGQFWEVEDDYPEAKGELWDIDMYDSTVGYAVGGMGGLGTVSNEDYGCRLDSTRPVVIMKYTPMGWVTQTVGNLVTPAGHNPDWSTQPVQSANIYEANLTLNANGYYEDNEVSNPITDYYGCLYGVYTIDRDTVVAVGGRSFLAPTNPVRILRTTDGGAHWISGCLNVEHAPAGWNKDPWGNNYVELPHGALLDVYFVNSTTGWAVGGCTATNTAGWEKSDGRVNPQENMVTAVLIMKTTDAGKTWFVTTAGGIQGVLTGVYFADSSVGYACGYRQFDGSSEPLVIYTTDGGATWTTMTVNANTSADDPLVRVSGVVRRIVARGSNSNLLIGIGDRGAACTTRPAYIIKRGSTSSTAYSSSSSSSGCFVGIVE